MKATLMYLAKISFIFCLLAAAVVAEMVVVSPTTLAPWQLRGAAASDLSEGGKLVLPAGAQLSRSFAASVVIVRMVSHSAAAKGSADWPVIELGPVAVAVMRDDGTSTAALVIGDEIVRQLPIAEEADLIVGYDAASGACVLKVGEQTLWTAAPQGRAAEVVLSAGASAPWAIDELSLEVTPIGAEVRQPNPASFLAPSSAAVQPEIDRFTVALRNSATALALPHRTDGGEAATTQVVAEVITKPADFELASPSAFRRGRAAVIRATIAQAAKR